MRRTEGTGTLVSKTWNDRNLGTCNAIVVFSKKFGNFLFKITILGNLEKIERFVKLQRMHVGTKLAARVDEGPRNSHGGAMRRRRSQCELLLRRRKR